MKNIFLTLSILWSTVLLANPVETGHAKASLITNLQSSSQESFYVGIRLQMQDGWHTYWENPGDSGSPFEATWTTCLLYTSPSPRDRTRSRMPSSA